MRPLGPILESLFRDLKSGDKEKRSLLQSQWHQIVGSSFAPHTKATLLKNGTLCVWADDSVMAYELSQRYRGTLLKRAEGALGEGTIQKIIFRVGQIR